MPACSLMSSVIVARRHGGVRSSSRSRYRNLVPPQSSLAASAIRLFGQPHDVAIVGVRLVQLEHGELGVPAIAEALVAEDAADLEDLLEATGDQPLEIQLGRHAQVHVHVERVVVRDERLRVRASRQRLQDRRLDFDEAAIFEPAPHERHEPAAKLEDPADVVADPQVDVALAVPRVGIGDAMPLVGERPLRFGEQRPLVDAYGELASLRGHDDPAHADPVAERQRAEADRSPAWPARWRTAGCARVESCNVPKASLPCTRRNMSRPATVTTRSVSVPGARPVELVVQRGRGRVGLVPVRNVGHGRFFSKINRRPCSVSQGSW